MSATTTRDRLTRTVTAFRTWGELEAGLRGGYCPTLRPRARPSRDRCQRKWDAAVADLAAAVRAAGYPVFDGPRA